MSGGNQKWKSKKKALVGAAILVIGGLVFGAFWMAKSAANFPMTDVKRKEFVDYLEIKGEVKAIRSAVIAAPYGAGDLQILRLVDNAAKVKKGDFLVEFDATASDLNSKTRAQVDRVDGMVTSVLNTTNDISETVQRGIKVPLREVSGDRKSVV